MLYGLKNSMTNGPPEIIAIDCDEHHAKHIGRTSDGRQFFLTTPFDPAISGRPGAEFIALYLFNERGTLIDAKIDELGPRAKLDETKARQLYDQRLQELGEVSFERIEIAPFSVQHSGLQFGLVLREPDEEGDSWAVEAQPGNYMAFFEPWDSGEYDT
jgi:hypothetical protein